MKYFFILKNTVHAYACSAQASNVQESHGIELLTY